MKEDFLEDIKKAISSTTRAIAEDKEIDVVFEDNLTSTDNKKEYLASSHVSLLIVRPQKLKNVNSQRIYVYQNW